MSIIYFARSIRGDHGIADKETNRAIYEAIKTNGHTPALDLPPIRRETAWEWDTFIFQRDLVWIDQSQAMIAEVSHASLGVGYEIAYAYHVRRIPILFLLEKESRTSAMISGGHELYLYRDLADLENGIRDFLTEIPERTNL